MDSLINEKNKIKPFKLIATDEKPGSKPPLCLKTTTAPTSHNLGKMERETKLYKDVEKNLSKDYTFNMIQTVADDINQAKQNVVAELECVNNGTPLKYNLQQLASSYEQTNYLPRSQSWNPNSRNHQQQAHQQQQPYWGSRMNTNRSDFSDAPALSPYGSQNNYYGTMTPGHHSYHSAHSASSKEFFPQQQQQQHQQQQQQKSSPKPKLRLTIPTNEDSTATCKEINPSTPNSRFERPHTTFTTTTTTTQNHQPPSSARRHHPNHNVNRNNNIGLRPQSCRRDYRGGRSWRNFNNVPGGEQQQQYQQQNRGGGYYRPAKNPIPQRPQSARAAYNPYNNGTPRGEMPTSCRLSQMAENDRHSFFPSSTRSSYKSVTHKRKKSVANTNSSKIRDEFLQICARLEAQVGKENLIYPREIIWMIGPPGAGKSTLARFLSEQRSYNSQPIVLREICQTVIAQNDGKLKIEQVVEQLMIKLFDSQYCNGVVVDGFVSTTCARVVPFMFKYFHEIYELSKNPQPPTFKFCVLYVNEDNSVRRQIVNYEQKRENKSNPTFDAEEGRKLYRKFLKRTQQVVELIEMHFSFSLIDANGTLPQVQMIASAEIASERNGALIHDATLTKALSPAANTGRIRRNSRGWKYQTRDNSYRNNSSYRSNKSSYRSNNSTSSIQSPSNHRSTAEFRLAPKNHPIPFCHSLNNVDLMQHLAQVEERELLSVLRQKVLEIIHGSNHDSRQAQNKIPMAKSISLDTTNFENIGQNYVVQPLVKATRAMMYWDPAGHCYLIDRRFQFFSLRSKFYQAAHAGEGLLDGILVVDTEGEIVFLAQDAATHQSKRLKDCWFSQRTHECKTAVEDLNASSDGSEPIHIEFLDPVPTRDIESLLEIIALKDPEEVRLLALGGRQIPVHGFSFVPDKTGFHAANGPKIYSWTFLEGAARDFKVKAPYDEEQVLLYLQGPKNADSCFQRAKFLEGVQEKFLEIVNEAVEAGMTKSFIVSCQYSKSARLWIPDRFQPTKTRAASINVVAESISSWENRMPLSELLSFVSGERVQLTKGQTSI